MTAPLGATGWRIASLAPWAPLLIVVVLILCWLWRERRTDETDKDQG